LIGPLASASGMQFWCRAQVEAQVFGRSQHL